MLKGSGLIRAYPRFNARIRRAKTATPTPVSRSTPTIFRLLWSSAGILCLTLSGIVMAVFLVLHLTVPVTMKLNRYPGIYPGLSLAALDSPACTAYRISPMTHEQECDLRVSQPDRERPCKITVSIFQDTIVKARFQCSDLYVGDLVQQWGRPDAISRSPGGYLLNWNDARITARAYGSQWFNYQLPVDLLIHT